MSVPIQRTYEVYQGGSISRTWLFAQDGTPLNLTACVAKMQLRTQPNPESPCLLALDSLALGGLTFVTTAIPPATTPPAYPDGVAFEITSAQSLVLPAGPLTFELYISPWPTTEESEPVITGTILVFGTGTR
jgi:hypothetical protein